MLFTFTLSICYVLAIPISGLTYASSVGTKFIVPFVYDSTGQTTMMISTTLSTPVNFSIRSFAGIVQGTAVFGITTKVDLPIPDNSTHTDETIRVLSTREVTLAVLMTGYTLLILPVGTMDTKYFIPAWAIGTTIIDIAAVSDGSTTIILPLSSVPGNIEHNGRTYTGSEVVTVTADQHRTLRLYGTGDVAGLLVMASKPIAVVVIRRVNGITNATWSMAEMLIPYRAWDKEFVGVPLPGNSKNETYNIIAGIPGAAVIINGSPDTTYVLGVQESVTVPNPNKIPFYITSSEPVHVTQYEGTDGQGMTLVHSVLGTSQWMSRYTLSKLPMASSNYVTIVAASSTTQSILFNNLPIPGNNWTMVPGTEYVYTSVDHSEDFVFVEHTNCSGRYAVYGYGLVTADRPRLFGYPAGLRVVSDLAENSHENATSCERPILSSRSTDAFANALNSVTLQQYSGLLTTEITKTFDKMPLSDTGGDYTVNAIMLTSEQSGLTSTEWLSVFSTVLPASTSSCDSHTSDTQHESEFEHIDTSTDNGIQSTSVADLHVYTQTVVKMSTTSVDLEHPLSSVSSGATTEILPSSHDVSYEGIHFTVSSQQDTSVGSQKIDPISEPSSPIARSTTPTTSTASLASASDFTFTSKSTRTVLDTDVHATDTNIPLSLTSVSTDQTVSSQPINRDVDAPESGTTVYNTIAIMAAAPVVVSIVAVSLWAGISKFRAAAQFNVIKHSKTAPVEQTRVTKMMRVQSGNSFKPQRTKVNVLRKQTTMTSLGSEASLVF